MEVTATVPILPGAALNQKRSYAFYPQSRRRGSSETVVAMRLSTSGLSPETILSHAPQARLTAHANRAPRSEAMLLGAPVQRDVEHR